MPFPVRVALPLLFLLVLFFLLLLLPCLPAQSSPLLAGLLTLLSSPLPNIRSTKVKICPAPNRNMGKRPFFPFFPVYWDVGSLGFLFNCQTLSLEVRGKERCSSMQSLYTSLQVATMSTWDRSGGPVCRAVWWQGGGSAKACPRCAMLQLAKWKDGWEKSLNGNLRCGTYFSCQKSG